MVPLTESISNRYPELTMITGGAETASRDTLTLVFWAASAGVELHFRIATPLRGKHEVVAAEATPERNRLRENPLGSGTVCPFPICKLSILLANAPRCQEAATHDREWGDPHSVFLPLIKIGWAALSGEDCYSVLRDCEGLVEDARRAGMSPAPAAAAVRVRVAMATTVRFMPLVS